MKTLEKMEGRVGKVGSAIGRGLIAGLAGTAAITLSQLIENKINLKEPNFAPAAKPIILLINEQTLSDGEMTAAGFRELNLGTIIGTETYRWIIFTSSARLIDGSSVRLPSWGCYTLDGKDLEKTGVAPDIFVKNTFEDRMNGNDPQLKRAVEEILKKL